MFGKRSGKKRGAIVLSSSSSRGGARPDNVIGCGADAVAAEDGQGSEEVKVTPSRLWGDGFGTLATRSLQTIIVLVLTGAIIFVIRELTTVTIPILLALIFASTFLPVMNWLRAHKVPSALATVIVLLSIIGILGGAGWLIVWAVQDQWDELAVQAHDGFLQVIDWAESLPFVSGADQLVQWRDDLVKASTDFLKSAKFGSGALAGVSALTSFFTGLVLLIVVLFFFLKDGTKIWRFMIRPFRGENLARAERVGAKTVDTLGHYVRGTASVAAVDATGIWIGLIILNVPLAIPLVVLTFILSFIPLVGATLAGILAALVALVANGPLSAVLVIGVVILVNQLEGNFLQPVLMGRALKLHALVILLALTVGTVLSGVLGAVLAVPLAAVAWGIVQVWDGPDLAARWARPKANELAAAKKKK